MDVGPTWYHVKSAVNCVVAFVTVVLCEPITFGSSSAICRESGYKGLTRRPPRRVASHPTHKQRTLLASRGCSVLFIKKCFFSLPENSFWVKQSLIIFID